MSDIITRERLAELGKLGLKTVGVGSTPTSSLIILLVNQDALLNMCIPDAVDDVMSKTEIQVFYEMQRKAIADEIDVRIKIPKLIHTARG